MLSTEICSILHMLRKPNSLIALLFIQNNSKFKNMAETYLPASMLNSSSIVYVEVCPVPQVFSKEQMSPPELSSCCFCHVFSYYSSCSSYSWREWNVRHFFFHQKIRLISFRSFLPFLDLLPQLRLSVLDFILSLVLPCVGSRSFYCSVDGWE